MAGGEEGGPGATTGPERALLRSTRDRSGRAHATGRRAVSALIDAVFAPAPGPDGDESQTSDDLQSVLGGAVRELARRTGAPRVCAWLTRDDAEPMMAAARWLTRDDPPAPDGETFAALGRLARPTDLGARDVHTGLARFAHRTGLGCALVVGPDGASEFGAQRVVLALGGPDDPPGRVRPRTLAQLEEVAARMRGPLTTALAISRLGRLDEVVRGLDRRAALGELVAEIVHEVRNPLVSVKTFLQLLPSRMDDREFLDDFRSLVVDEVTRLERLLDSVLQHARPSVEDATRGVADVDEVFGAITRLLDHRASERRVTLSRYVDAGVGEVAMARDALRQVVLNLTLNALDATPAGGGVRLRAHAQSVVEGRFVEIRIEDDGPGIPAAERRRIFEPFYSTRESRPGGLGLAITQRLVEASGGVIQVRESPGGGAVMAVRLRAAERR